MAADKAAPKAAEQQDAALRQLLASMRCKQYKKAREACTAALAAGAEPKLMKDYAAVRRGGVRVDAVRRSHFPAPSRFPRMSRVAQALDAVIAQRAAAAAPAPPPAAAPPPPPRPGPPPPPAPRRPPPPPPPPRRAAR